MQHLFQKQLSKQYVGAYRKLCRGVGVSFEALLVDEPNRTAEEHSLEGRGIEKAVVHCVDISRFHKANRDFQTPRSALLL